MDGAMASTAIDPNGGDRRRDSRNSAVPSAYRTKRNDEMKLTAKQKAKDGMALNLTELAAVTGYSYSVLKHMKKVADFDLIHGKIREQDFWKSIQAKPGPDCSDIPTSAFSSPESAGSMQAIVDGFRAPRPSNGR